MARHSEGAWYRTAKGAWYATVDGRKVALGVKGKANRKAAQEAWCRLMAGVPPVPTDNPVSSRPEPTAPAPTVAAVADAFLAAKKGTVADTTHYVYGCALKRVKAAFGDRPAAGMTAAELSRWLPTLTTGEGDDERPVSASTRSDFAGVLCNALAWAEAEGLIPANPLRGFRKPRGESRGAKVVVSDDAHAKLMEAAGPAFRLVLTLLRETGCRPSEVARLTAADVDFTNACALLREHKTARHTARPRLIMLTPAALAVLREQADRHPTGPLLRNSRGNAWDKNGIGLAMRRASERAGVKCVAYGYRHAFATHALANGVPDATVAALLGHTSTAMLHRHYSHLTAQAGVLREALTKVRG